MSGSASVPEVVTGIFVLLLIACAVYAATKRVRLPFTVALVVVGFGLAAFAAVRPHLLPGIGSIRISPDLILFVFLPTLIFESAFNLDARQLRRNLGAVMMLAVPGLLVSTAAIGAVVALATPVPAAAALLLGAILSATDPVAVVAIFRRLGAPQRLRILVEGESLFNDATSIVLARILLGAVLVGSVSEHAASKGALEFAVVFAGGLVVGWLCGLATGYLLGKIESNALIETTLTTGLAYISYLIAEETFHVSGVMATIAAGITVGGWGRMKLSASVRRYLEQFWVYISFVANALIFLLVGLRVRVSELEAAAPLIFWAIAAMLVSRAVVVFGLMPFVGKVRGSEPVGWRYQAVMYWGGLRGAIALAIALSLPAFPYRDQFVAATMGAVLFTLLVQATSMEWLVKRLGLDRPPLIERFVRTESALAARERALGRLPDLLAGGLFSGPIAARLRARCEAEIEEAKARLEALYRGDLGSEKGRPVFYLRTFAEEKALYIEMFGKGQLTERAFRDLALTLALQTDAVRSPGADRNASVDPIPRNSMEKRFVDALGRVPGFAALAERLRRSRVAIDYEITWARFQGGRAALELLSKLSKVSPCPIEAVLDVQSQYLKWSESEHRHLDQTAEQYPEFVHALQERLGRRLILFAEAETYREQAEYGTLPQAIAEDMQEEISERIRELRGAGVEHLRVEPAELLRKVPSFMDVPEEQFAALASRLRARTVNRNETVIRQGEAGSSAFLIARGVVRVSREEGGTARDLTTLIAGDFFGEIALLRGGPRTATVTAVTPCSLYELRREDLDLVIGTFPALRAALEGAHRRRRGEPEPDLA